MTVRDSAQPGPRPLLFADGSPRAVAALWEQLGECVPTLTGSLANALRDELGPLAARVAERAAPQATAFVAAVDALDLGEDRSLSETLLAMLAFDGLIAPVVRRLMLGDEQIPILLAVEATTPTERIPFLRACARPSTGEPAAVFCCGERFPLSGLIDATLSEDEARQTLATISSDGSLVLSQPARIPLLRIGAITVKQSFAELTTGIALPLLTPERLATLRAPALVLARAVLTSDESPQTLAVALRDTAGRILPDFPATAALLAALGVLAHEVAERWRTAGILTQPDDYRLGAGDEPVRIHRLWSIDMG